MVVFSWLVRFVRTELPTPTPSMPFVADLPVDWVQWLQEVGVPVGTPFLLSRRLCMTSR